MPSALEAPAAVSGLPASGRDVTFARFCVGVTACHVATYFVAGILAYLILDYRTFLQTGPLSQLMRPIDSTWVAAGPALQVLRCAVMALALYPIRRFLLEQPRGWLTLWGLFVGLAILSTCGAAPGSLEGFVYTRLRVVEHLRALPEVVLQTMAFSWLLIEWFRRPGRRLRGFVGVVAAIAIVMSVLGVVLPRPGAFGGN